MDKATLTDVTPGAGVARRGICVLVNERSGRDRPDGTMGEVRAAFSKLGVEVEVRKLSPDETVEEQTRRAIEDGFGTIVAAGGDGTINGVAGGALGSGCRMGVLPAGTFNYFVRSLGLPETFDEAAAVVVDGDARAAQVGLIDDRVFLNNASLGSYAAVLEEREETYRRWGRSRLAAYWSTVRALIMWRGSLRVRIEVDGETQHYRTPLIFIVNNAYQLDEIGLGGRECVEKGEMVVFVAADTGRWGMLRHAFALMTGFGIPRHTFTRFCCREMRIRTNRRRQIIARDGERARVEGEMHVRVVHDDLHILSPKEQGEVR